MIRHLFCAVAAALVFSSAQAQEHSDVIIDEHNKDSSSFVVDPDPLDPLPVKRENIKDGDEIILDDIRQVLDSKLPEVQQSPSETSGSSSEVKASSTSSRSNQKSIRSSRKSTKTSSPVSSPRSRLRSADDPDFRIENRLYQQYRQYDQTPTSSEQWSQATEGQKENIYVVQKTDNLYTISRTLFGDSKFWPKIWALNRDSIYNPHQIYPGMKIYFYSGDGQNAPTLSFTSQAGSVTSSNNELVQNTEFGNIALKAQQPEQNRAYPVAIPNSLPQTYSAKYFEKEKSTVELDIRDLQYNEPESFSNPYTLSSTELKSDFYVPANQIQNLLCKDNQFVPMVVKNNPNVGAGNFLIVEKLIDDKTRLKKTFKYKRTGTVTINEKNQLRVSDCKQLMDVDTLIISEEKLAAASEPTEAFQTPAHIVDGFDYLSQDIYVGNQYLIINVNGVNAETGSRLNVYSDSMGKVVGRLRVIQKVGTMAIAVVTEVNDQISHGDRIVE